MAPKDVGGNRTDLISKDAMYLFELLRDSPQPITIHIASYAEKTGTKVNTIQKRLSEIKKRHSLNIITTANTSGAARASTATTVARPAATVSRSSGGGKVTKPRIKREMATTTSKTTAPSGLGLGLKVEDRESSGSSAMHGLPSPVASADSPQYGSTSALPNSNNFLPTKVNTQSHAQASQMPSHMPQKHTLFDLKDEPPSLEDGNVLKKVKTESWGFS